MCGMGSSLKERSTSPLIRPIICHHLFLLISLSSQKWSANSDTLNWHFNLPSISDRRNYFKLLFTYKLVSGHLYCPPGFLNLRANPNLRVCHCKQLIPPFDKTTSCTFS